MSVSVSGLEQRRHALGERRGRRPGARVALKQEIKDLDLGGRGAKAGGPLGATRRQRPLGLPNLEGRGVGEGVGAEAQHIEEAAECPSGEGEGWGWG